VGEVLDVLVQRRRDDSRAALRLMRKLLKEQGFAPRLLVTDKLRSYASAFRTSCCYPTVGDGPCVSASPK
jgi:transposase-like protein